MSHASARDELYPVSKGLILAKKYEKRLVPKLETEGVWVSEKLDGVRACWNGVELRSRVDKPICAPEWFLELLPKALPLDGELYIGKEMFNEISGVVRKKKPIDEEWKKITFRVFDVPVEDDTPYEERLELLSVLSTEASAVCKEVAKVKVFSEGALMACYNEMVKEGAEGVMLRIPGSKYSPKRTSDLLKLKPFFDFEVIVYDHEVGKGKYKGKLGALMVHLIDQPDVTFKVGTGLCDNDRETYKTSIPIGCKVTVSYQSINEKTGVPRFPAFVGVRSVD